MQDRFIAALAENPSVLAVAAELRIDYGGLLRLRRRDPKFARRWHDAIRIRPGFRKPTERWTRRQSEEFLSAFAELGSAAAAARHIGASVQTAYAVRNRDADFASAWSEVRREHGEQIEDRLIEGALNGFEEVRIADGKETRVRRTNPRVMMDVAKRLLADVRGNGRWIEVTPEATRKARASLVRKLTSGGGLTTMAEAIEEASATTAAMREDEALG